MAFTNIGLVDFAKRTVREGNWVYLMGSIGNYLTSDFLKQKAALNQHNWYTSSKVAAIQNVINTAAGRQYRCVDCVGLIKCYYWNDYRQGNASGYRSNTDVSADTMYRIATEKGPIGTIPEIPGLAVWMSGHIGVYLGNGMVIESTPNTKYAKYSHGLGGPCETALQGRGWSHWLKIPYIQYIDEKVLTGSNNEITWRNPINMDEVMMPYTGKWVLTKDNIRWSYRFNNGDYPANCWFKVDGKYYHFDANGYMQTGWLKDKGLWYYLDPSKNNEGAMVTGLRQIDNKIYYMKPNGAMAEDETVTLYADDDGVLFYQ